MSIRGLRPECEFERVRDEFVKTFVQTGDLLYKELSNGNESTTAKLLTGGLGFLSSELGLLIAGPVAGARVGTAAAKPIATCISELDKAGQKNDKLALEHAVNHAGQSSSQFQLNLRKIMILSGLEICHSYAMQLCHASRKIKKNQLSASFFREGGQRLVNFLQRQQSTTQQQRNQMQAIQKLAIYAASCTISHMLEHQKIDNPHQSVTKPGLDDVVKAWYSQFMVDGIRVEWPGEHEIGMNAADFFKNPIPAFERQAGHRCVIEIVRRKGQSTDLVRQRHEVRRPFSFELVPDYHTTCTQFLPISVYLNGHLVDASDFIGFIPSQEQVDTIYEKLVTDPTFDHPETVLRNFEMLKQKADEAVGGIGRLEEKVERMEKSLEKVSRLLLGDPIWFNVDNPVESFTGRFGFLSELHTADQRQSESGSGEEGGSPSPTMRVIVGLGGVGKTETARKYIEEYKGHYENVIWIHAQSRSSMVNSFLDLGSKLGIDLEVDRQMDAILDECYSKLCQRTTLIVFNKARCMYDLNDGEEDNGISSFLPRSIPAHLIVPSVLVTSRNVDCWTTTARILRLDTFGDLESSLFIQKELKETCQNDQVTALALLLGGLPLALKQAVSYIQEQQKGSHYLVNQTKYSIADYLHAFEVKWAELLGHVPNNHRRNTTVLTTWSVTLDHLKGLQDGGPLANRVSQVMSLLCPDDVPLQFLYDLFNDLEKEATLSLAVGLLGRYSLVKACDDEKAQAISMHRLVQQTILNDLLNEGRLDDLLRSLVGPCHKILNAATSTYYSNRYVMNNLLSIVDKFSLVPVTNEFLQLERSLAAKLAAMRRDDQALNLLTHIINKQSEISTDSTIMESTNDLALLHFYKGQFDQAMNLFETVCQIQRNCGEDEKIISTMQNMAMVLHRQGKFEEARGMYEKVYDAQFCTMKEHDPRLLSTKSNIAEVLYYEGNFDAALPMLNEVYEAQLTSLDAKDPKLLATMHSIASIQRSRGHFKESLEMFKKVHEAQLKALSKDDPVLLSTVYRMAALQNNHHRYEEAIGMLQKGFQKQQQILDFKHPDLLSTMQNIASILRHQAKYDESLLMYQELFEIQRQMLPKTDPKLLSTRQSIGFLLDKQGKYVESMRIYQEIWDIQTESFGMNDERSLCTQHCMAGVLCNQGRYDESLAKLKHVCRFRIHNLNPHHPALLSTMQDMASVLRHQKNYIESMALYKILLEQQKAIFDDPQSPEILSTMHDIAALLDIQKKHDEAMGMLRTILDAQSQSLQPEHPSILKTMDSIGTVLSHKGFYDDAMEMYTKVLEMRKNELGPRHPDVLKTMHNIGLVRACQYRFEEAIQILEDVLHKRAKALGHNHPATISTQINLEQVQENMRRSKKDAACSIQ